MSTSTIKQKSNLKHSAAKFNAVSVKGIFIFCAFFSVIAVFGIIGYILYAAIPAFGEVGFFKFIFGTRWYSPSGEYGILPMIVSTLVTTVGAIVLGGTIGVFTAVFLVFWCPKKLDFKYNGKNKFVLGLKRILSKVNLCTIFDQIIKVLAGIPSVIFGYFGANCIVAMLSNVDPYGIGNGALASSLVLGIMVLPTVTSLTKNALESVLQSYFEGALALGNTKSQAVFKVVMRAAKRGIISALILGIGRAVGETMAVAMVSGGRVYFPGGLFTPIQTLTTNIAAEWADAGKGITASALFACGFVLLVLVLIINFSINLVPKEFKGKRGNRKLNASKVSTEYKKKGGGCEIFKVISMVSAAVVTLILFTLLGFIFVKGIRGLNLKFLFGLTDPTEKVYTLLPSFITTGYIILITLIISLPIGIGAAIYLVEYAKPGSKPVKVLRIFVDTLAGVPSIVFGLFGNLLFCKVFGGYSAIAGAFTMVLVVLPAIIRSTEESLLAVPMSLREASYGLGASKIRTIFKVTLPSAFPGIATAAVLSIGRIIGESAALIYTSGMLITSADAALNPLNMGSTLAVFLYMCWAEPTAHLGFAQAYSTAVVLLIITLALNLTVYFIQRHVKNKR